MSLEVDKESIRKAIRRARFPRDFNLRDIELSVENDAMEALRDMGVTSGKYRIVPGEVNYDVITDKKGRKIVKKVKL